MPPDSRLSIDSALASMYRTFVRYRPAGSIEHSPLKPHGIVAPLETKPLQALDAADLCGYSGSAIWTVGTESDFKYFFPRIAELAIYQVVGSATWDSWLERLVPALSSSDEVSAIQTFLRAIWSTISESYWNPYQIDVVDLIYAVSSLFPSLEEFLAVFEPCATRAAVLHLTDLCIVGPNHMAPQGKPHGALQAWFQCKALPVITDATTRFPPTNIDDELAFERAVAAAYRCSMSAANA